MQQGCGLQEEADTEEGRQGPFIQEGNQQTQVKVIGGMKKATENTREDKTIKM